MKNGEIAFLEFVSPNALISINNSNNIFEYRLKPIGWEDPMGVLTGNLEWFTIEIETGCYSINSLQNYIKDYMPQYVPQTYPLSNEVIFYVYFELKDNKATLRVSDDIEVRFTHSNSFGKVVYIMNMKGVVKRMTDI